MPFYVYEFEARSGYAIPLAVIERLRATLPNFAGMKVSDSPWEKVEPYLLDGLDVFIGAEALLERGLAAGAAGAVSGLASCFPDAVVPLVREPTTAKRGARHVAPRLAPAAPVPRRGEDGARTPRRPGRTGRAGAAPRPELTASARRSSGSSRSGAERRPPCPPRRRRQPAPRPARPAVRLPARRVPVRRG